MRRRKRHVHPFSRETVVLRTTGCRECGGLVYVCKECAAGQLYCGPLCRQAARRRQTREANRRYLDTEAGRQRNRERQRRFRERNSRRDSSDATRVRVSQSLASQAAPNGCVTEQPMPPETQKRPVMPHWLKPDSDSASMGIPRLPCCTSCGRASNVFDLRSIPSPVSQQRRWRRFLRRLKDSDPSFFESVQISTD